MVQPLCKVHLFNAPLIRKDQSLYDFLESLAQSLIQRYEVNATSKLIITFSKGLLHSRDNNYMLITPLMVVLAVPFSLMRWLESTSTVISPPRFDA